MKRLGANRTSGVVKSDVKKVPKITLTLVVEYDAEHVTFGDAVEAAKELRDRANEYGSVTLARIEGLPPTLEL